MNTMEVIYSAAHCIIPGVICLFLIVFYLSKILSRDISMSTNRVREVLLLTEV